MITIERSAASFKCLAEKRFGLVLLAVMHIQFAQNYKRIKCLGVFVAEAAPSRLERVFPETLGYLRVTKRPVNARQVANRRNRDWVLRRVARALP